MRFKRGDIVALASDKNTPIGKVDAKLISGSFWGGSISPTNPVLTIELFSGSPLRKKSGKYYQDYEKKFVRAGSK